MQKKTKSNLPANKISFHCQNSVIIIEPDNVIYCKRTNQGILVYMNNGTESYYNIDFQEFEQKIPSLLKSHIDYLINLNYVDVIPDKNREVLKMTNGSEVPINHDTRILLLKELNKHIQ